MKILAVDISAGRVILAASQDEIANLRGFRSNHSALDSVGYRVHVGLEIDVGKIWEAVRICLERRPELERIRRLIHDRLREVDAMLEVLDPEAKPEIET